MRLHSVLSLALLPLLSGSLALAQQPEGGPPPPSARMSPRHAPRSMDRDRGDGMRPDFRIAPPGMWWKKPDLVQKLTLTADQQKRMDDIFQKSRLDLIDLKAALERQEVLLQPMLAENPPDTNKVLAQIDKVAQARADLEKSNARMLLGIRGILSPDQWTKLQTEDRDNRHRMMMRRFERPDHRDKLRGPNRNESAPPPPPAM
jgi:Spy/CpxP family protein refolding chaperone